MTRNTHDAINDHFTTETDTTKVLQPDGAGGVVFNPASSGPGLLNPSSIIGPFTLAADTDNWNPTGLLTAGVIEINPSADINLTGILSVFAAQWTLALLNVGSFNVTLKNLDGASSGLNRFALPNNTDLVIPPQGGVILFYEAVIGYWFVLGEGVPAGTGGGGMTVDVQTIVRSSGSYLWTKPGNAKTVEVVLIGAGGGGGGGGNESSGALGGSGGGGGGMSRRLFQASDLGATENTEPGAGGGGGGAGSNGGTGGASYFGADHLTSPQDAKLTAGGGIGGVAGVAGLTRQNGTPPGFGNQASAIGRWDRNAPTAQGLLPLISGGSSVNPNDLYVNGGSMYYAGGGGAGGSISAGTVPTDGGYGGTPVEEAGPTNANNNGPDTYGGYKNGGTVGASQAGGNGHTNSGQALYYGGFGGGGGAGRHQSAATAGKGGAGSIYGGGGGGGGAGNTGNSVTPGAGGDGADGVVVVITYCSA